VDKNETLAYRLQELAEKENVILDIKFDGRSDSMVFMVLHVTYGDKHVKAAYDGYELEKVRLFGIDPEHDDYFVETFENLIGRIKNEEKLKILEPFNNVTIFDCSTSKILSIDEIAEYSIEEIRQFGNKILDGSIRTPNHSDRVLTELLGFVEMVLGKKRDLFKRF